MASTKRLPRTLNDTVIVPSSDCRKPIGRDLEISYFCENGFPFAVKVMMPNGLAVTLPPHGNVGINNLLNERVYDFIIRMRLKHTQAVKIDTNNILDGVTNEQFELMAVSQAIQKRNSQLSNTLFDFSIDYKITRQQFEEAGNVGVYVPSCNLTLCHANMIDVAHPNGAEGAAILANESKDLVGYLYRIEIVDPYDQYGVRFVNIAGKIDRVYPIKDLKRQPGVYLNRVMRRNLDAPADITPEYYSFEEATKILRLYRTEDEAKALGDVIEAQKRESEQRILELKNNSIELEAKLRDETMRAKMQATEIDSKRKELEELREVVKALREEKMAKLKEEIEKRGLERDDHYDERSKRRDDYYDQRSSSRKDDSEWVKWVPAVIVGGGLLAYKLFF